jgi:hypothetical protein
MSASSRWWQVAIVVGLGCAPGGKEVASAVVIDTVAGIERVRNPATVRQWNLREIARIGSVDSGPAAFGRAGSVVADARGAIYVADWQASEIRVFREDGTHLRTFGRRGAGPAEFARPASLAFLGDTLMVLDPGNARIGLLTPAGAWAGQIQHQRASGDVRLYQVGGDVYNVGFPRSGRIFVRYVRAGSGDRAAFDSVKPGIWVDTVPYPMPRGGPVTGIDCEEAATGMVRIFTLPSEMEANRFPRPAPNGQVAIADHSSHRVAFVAPGGDTTRIVDGSYEPIAVTDSAWAKATAEFGAYNPIASAARCSGSFTRLQAYPAIRYFEFDADGHMWVEVASAGGSVYEVFDATGRQLGRLPAPDREASVPLYARGDRLYLVQADSLGVQQVVVYAIER